MPKYNLSEYAFKRKEEEVPLIDLRRRYSDEEMAQFNETRRRLAKRANARLLGFERAGLDTTYVYKTTMKYLLDNDRMRFSESRTVDKYTLKKDLAELSAFLKAQTSTVGGYRAYLRRVKKKLAKHGIDADEFDDFIAFMSSSEAKQAMHQVSSDFLVEFFDRANDAGVSIDDLKEALQEYNEGNIDGWDEVYEYVGLSFIEDNSDA